jgi:hypothetical protein
MILAKQELRTMFFRCDTCIDRNICRVCIPSGYCQIEEQIFFEFYQEASGHYGLEPIDRFALYNAAMSMLRGMRANRVLAKISVGSGEDSRLTWLAVRESKEFRDGLKELGISRKERVDQLREKEGLGAIKGSNMTLAEILSEVREYIPEDVEVKVEQRFEIKKRRTAARAKALRREYEDEYEEVEDNQVSTTDKD